MENPLIKRPSECSILIVDDEKVVLDLLAGALAGSYRVTACSSGRQACAMIEEHDFDVVITDLKLPDVSGLEVIKLAKSKDEYTEGIMITGYASLDSATNAINLGVGSYLTKPLGLTEFRVQVEKAVASRMFHLKSVRLMQQSDYMTPDVKGHLNDITSLYYFTRKLTLSLEISEIMRITLEEVNQKTGAPVAAIGVNLLGYTEAYAMPASGTIDQQEFAAYLEHHRERILPYMGREHFDAGSLPLIVYKGKQGESPALQGLTPQAIPMIVTGKTIGALVVLRDATAAVDEDQSQFLYVFASLVSSIVEHGYADMQARLQAKTDGLTGIANHRMFQETLDREIARSNRRKGEFALLLIDIDDFKRINDTHGHQTGDAVLVDLTRRISSIIRAGDVLARYGGEEFGLILPDTGLAGADILARRVCQEIGSKPFAFSHHELTYTASLGLAVYTGGHPVSKDALIKAADSALYESKHAGKNRVTIGAAVT